MEVKINMSGFAKIEIKADLKIVTGLHIGASDAFSAIGATDSPVIKDPLSNKPVIPGSSLKGKMRSLLAQTLNDQIASNPSEDNFSIRRLFGDSHEVYTGRLIFRDAFLQNEDDLYERGARTLTEIKFENTIDRITSGAMPRQIERVIRGSIFNFELVYDLEASIEDKEVLDDFNHIIKGLNLLEFDYLGGNGSRGYGQIEFEKLTFNTVIGEINQELNYQLSNILNLD